MKKLLAIGAGLFASLFVRQAQADDTSLEGLLSEEVVTSVSKSAESAHDAPALTRSISAEEIRRYGMTSVIEALDFLGVGVHVEHSLGRSELTVRGVNFTGDRSNHVLVLLDGHPLNEPLIGDASLDQRLGVPLEMIDHVELVLGPGSAMYGTNAVLAVVNVVSKSAKTMKGFHAVAEAGAVGTLRSTLTGGHSFDLFRKRAELTAGLTYFRQDSAIDLARQDLGTDPVTGQRVIWGGTADDAYRSDVVGLRLRFQRDGLQVNGRLAFSNLGDPSGISDFDHPQVGSIERRGSLNVAQHFALGRVGELTLSGYGRAYENERRLVISREQLCPAGAKICDYRDRERSSRFGTDARVNFDWLHDGRVVTAAGVGASLDAVSATSEAADDETKLLTRATLRAVDVAHVLNLNANAQQTLKPFSWLDLVAGGRVDWRRISDDDASQETPGVFTPRLAVATRPWAGATAKVIYAEAFRAPNPYEVDARMPTLIQSENLRPEKAESIEAIFEQRVGAQRFMAGAFRTEYHGIINRVLLSEAEQRAAYLAGLTPVRPSSNAPIYQFRADDYVETRGFNVGFDGTLLAQRFHYGATFTGTLARADRSERILAAPQWFGNARVAYDLGGSLPTAALATTFAGNATSDRAYDAGYRMITMAPPSLEVRATLTGAVPWVKGLSYRAIVAHQQHESTPFAVGPTLRATTGYETTPLSPAQPWNVLLGLQYDFGD